MRGKVKFKTDLFSFSRITPAYAGEKATDRVKPVFVLGSPPPMRGKAHN